MSSFPPAGGGGQDPAVKFDNVESKTVDSKEYMSVKREFPVKTTDSSTGKFVLLRESGVDNNTVEVKKIIPPTAASGFSFFPVGNSVGSGTEILQIASGHYLFSELPFSSGTVDAKVYVSNTGELTLTPSDYICGWVTQDGAVIDVDIYNGEATNEQDLDNYQKNSNGILFQPDDCYAANHSSASVTGAIKIQLPVSWSGTMMSLDVDIFDYLGSGESRFHLKIGGYNSTYNSAWAACSAHQIGGDRDLTVRWGHDGSKACIYIGNDNAAWAYPRIRVTNFSGSYSNYAKSTWESGWTLSFGATGQNVDVTILAKRKFDPDYPDPQTTTNTSAISTNTTAIAKSAKLDEAVFPSVGGGSLVTESTSVTGAIRIKLPTTWSQSQVALEIFCLEEAPDKSNLIRINAYQGTDSSQGWYDEIQVKNLMGSKDIKVRFGYITENSVEYPCIWLGEDNEVWDWPSWFIQNLCVGYKNTEYTRWSTGWEISTGNGVQNLQRTITAKRDYSEANPPPTDSQVATNTSNIATNAADILKRQRDDLGVIFQPDGGFVRATQDANVGAIKIRLPQSWTNTMIQFTVTVFNFEDNQTTRFLIAGLLDTPLSKWRGMSASMEGNDQDIQVRFGHDGTKAAVYLGSDTYDWRWAQVSVSNVTVGWNNYDKDDWDSGWQVTLSATAQGVVSGATLTATKQYDSGNKPTAADLNVEPAFSKNNAFNKNFGTSSGTVAEGNDSRILQVATNTTDIGNRQRDDLGVLFMPEGCFAAEHLDANVTGAIKIRLPVSWTGTMMSLDIDIFDYTAAGNSRFNLKIGGYNSSIASSWAACSADQVGGDRNLSVKFGHDGTKACIYIGADNELWAYPRIVVNNFIGSYTNYAKATWDDNWELTFEETAQNVDVTLTAKLPFDADNPDPNTGTNTTNIVKSAKLDEGFLPSVGGGTLITEDSSRTGVVRIKLPSTWSQTQLALNIFCLEEDPNKSNLLHINAYQGNNSSQGWYDDIQVKNMHGSKDIRVRFGYITESGTEYPCIYLGEDNEVWDWPSWYIFNVCTGYKNVEYTRWNDGWEISTGNAVENVQRDTTAVRDYNPNNLPPVDYNDSGAKELLRQTVSGDTDISNTTQTMLTSSSITFTHSGLHSAQLIIKDMTGRHSDGIKLRTRVYQGTTQIFIEDFEQNNIGDTDVLRNFSFNATVASSVMTVTMQVVDASGTALTDCGDITLVIYDAVVNDASLDSYVYSEKIRPDGLTLFNYSSEFNDGDYLGKKWDPNSAGGSMTIKNGHLQLDVNGAGTYLGRSFPVNNTDFVISTRIIRNGHLANGLEAGLILLENETSSSDMFVVSQAGNDSDYNPNVRLQKWVAPDDWDSTEADISFHSALYVQLHFDASTKRVYVRFSDTPEGCWYGSGYVTIGFTPTRCALGVYASSGGSVKAKFPYLRYKEQTLNVTSFIDGGGIGRIAKVK